LAYNTYITAAIALLGLGVSLPFLGPTKQDTRFQPIPISMSQAVEAAEMVIPGQAIDARLEIVEGSPVYAIHILDVDNSLSTVKVNGEDGEITVVLHSDDQQQGDELIRFEQGGSI
jgi:peptidase YpeB-like protein